MFRTLARWLRGKPTPPPLETKESALAQADDLAPASEENHSHPVAYDENLLERSRTQWQFGDWASLAKLERSTLQHHPDRARLALLTAAARLQTGQDAEAKTYIRLAQDWGASKRLTSQILVAGVYNSLGRAAVIGNQHLRALAHLESAIAIGMPGSDAKLLTHACTFHKKNLSLYKRISEPKLHLYVRYHLNSIAPSAPSASKHKEGECPSTYKGIFEWKPENGGRNFGDHLGIIIAKAVYSRQSWERISSGDIYIHAFIGSVLSNSNIKKMISSGLKPVLLGCGFRGEKIDRKLINECLILGCRGQLTQLALKEAGLEIPPTGDPATLLPILMPINSENLIQNKSTILVPHILDKNKLNYSLRDIGCDKIIQPTTYESSDVEKLIYEIASSNFVLAGAMHAAVIAYAYNVPFAFFNSETIDCPPKWNDFAMSAGLSIKEVSFHSNVDDGIEWYAGIKNKLTRPDLTALLRELAKLGDLNPRVISFLMTADQQPPNAPQSKIPALTPQPPHKLSP